MIEKEKKVEKGKAKEEEKPKEIEENSVAELSTEQDKEKIEKKENTEKQEEKKDSLMIEKRIEIDEVKLQKIEEEIKKQTTIPKEKKKKINKKIFQNLIIAVAIVLYFMFLNLGFTNLESNVFLKDLQVFSLVTIGIPIIIFEKAYKKEDGELAIYGIETLLLAICILMTLYIKANYETKFTYIVNSISIVFAIYYIGKCMVIYTKMRKKALKRTSDITKIGRVKE